MENPPSTFDEDECMTKKVYLEMQIRELQQKRDEINNKIKALVVEREELENQLNLNQLRKAKNSAETIEFVEEKFEWSDDIEKILKEKFKFQEFRSKQLAAINGTLSKKDVLLVMPTGGGKSLVYQLPAMICKHLTLVVSPLISLIDDQLRALKDFGIEGATINSTSSKAEKNQIFFSMTCSTSNLRLLYVTPEWLVKSKVFINHLQNCYKKGYLDRIVIDEVHCCTIWGHDFRPEYHQLGLLKTTFPDIPLLGLTATATMRTLVDVQKTLNIPNSLIIMSPFNRPNLYYKIVPKPQEKVYSFKYLENLLKNQFKNQSGIVYCTTTTECDELVKELRYVDIEARAYHAPLDSDIKKRVYKQWLENKVQVIIATIAFGMGIDKPNVRFVIHYCTPKTLEGLYQESGRAGRDGAKAHCILMFSLGDHLRNAAMCNSSTELENTRPILNYCLEQKKCRRALLAIHFEDDWRQTDCAKMCDHCKRPKNLKLYNVTSALIDIHRIIEKATAKEIKVTLIKLMQAWYKTGPKDLKVQSTVLPKCSKELGEEIVAHFIHKEYLKLERGYTLFSTVPYIVKGKNIPVGEIIAIMHGSNLGYPIIDTSNTDSSQGPSWKKLKTY